MALTPEEKEIGHLHYKYIEEMKRINARRIYPRSGEKKQEPLHIMTFAEFKKYKEFKLL